jgi:Contractile injection system spike tip protein
MMSLIVIDGDELGFDPLFDDCEVTITTVPALIRGSGQATVSNKKVCIVGDETKVKLSAIYKTTIYTIPGAGTVTISALDSSQKVTGCTSGAALITKGLKFEAIFTIDSPAFKPNPPPAPPTADPRISSKGEGAFITQQNFAMAGTT